MSSWQRQMEEAAVRIAFPDWTIHPTDSIILSVNYNPGYCYSEYTMENSSYEISVQVTSEANGVHFKCNLDTASICLKIHRSTTYSDEDSVGFWNALMRSGD